MKSWEQVDFRKLADRVKQPPFGRDELTILGGQCAESEITKLIEHWDWAKMPFRIWEYSSEIIFERDTHPKNLVLLERGRLFGEGGDLMLRRNGGGFDWRFIGPAGVLKPTKDYNMQNYWESNRKTFHQDEKTTLLWGKWDGNQWIEDRVGSAKLNYPMTKLLKDDRIQLTYKAFSYSGQLEFVWYTGLSKWSGD
jgi:hypothetical protein